MSAIAGAPPVAPLPAPQAARVPVALPPIVTRVATFAALAAFCLGHYAVLVVPAGENPLVGVVFATALGGLGLAASARLSGRSGRLARAAIVVAMTVLALALTGVAPRLLLPGHWDDLGRNLDHGFAALDRFAFPYEAADHWVRLTILLLMPLLAVPAAALAFWPARRFAAGLRVAALLPLLVLYATGITNLDPARSWALRGVVLLLLIAAYLWLPRLRGRQVLPAIAAVGACALAALPLAAGLDARQPWVDYHSWTWFSARPTGTTFNWDHVYGPIAWSRTGTILLEVRSKEPHYWKAETLDRFDGLRWLHVETPYGGADASADIPTPVPRRWDERLTVNVRKLDSSVVVGAGTIYRTSLDRSVSDDSDGTIKILDNPLQEGDTYTVNSYVPDPTAAQMRAAPPAFPQRLASYTAFDLPARGASGLDKADLSSSHPPTARGRTLSPPVPGAPLTPSDRRAVLGSPYGRTYRLAKRLAAGQPTAYDTVRSVERYLHHGYLYDEKPPARRYPLAAFLFQDRRGYCQQFSGAMALMLRMDGIPARVAAGFSPGALNPDTHQYEVRDFDAHSWVEVWFAGIGWVPFDPTPSSAPAGAQSSSSGAASAARGGRGENITASIGTRQREGALASAPASPDHGSPLWPIVAGLSLLTAFAVAALWLAGILRARPHFAATADGAVQELRAALDRLGYRYPERTTLAELERRLRVTNGEPAARYVETLRALRYAPPGRAHPPGQRERRDLRRALTAGGGPLARLRGLVVLPPHPRRRAF